MARTRSTLPPPRPRVRGLPARAAALALGCALLASAAPQRPADERAAKVVATLAELDELEEEERFGEILEKISPDQREAYLFVSWFGAACTAAGDDPEAARSYRAIVEAHELDEEWLETRATARHGLRGAAAKALRDVDLAELLQDLASFRLEHDPFGVAFGFDGPVRELHVEEDWARVRVGRSDFELVRRGRAWLWWPIPDLDG